MARDGSGVYSNPYPNFVAGTVISSTEVDANNAAMGTALTGSIAADGQTTVTGNLPMATYKFTGLGAGAASTDSANLGQVQAGAYIWCGTMGGAADAGTLSPTPAITAYAAGQRFAWKASTNTNTGAMTIAISGLATIAAQSDRTALAAGDHVASDIYVGILDTTSTMQIMKFAPTSVSAATTSAAGIVELSTSAENLAGTAVTSPTVAGVREMTSLVPQNIQAGNYTAVLLDQGKHIYHASDAGASDTYTIPANASVAYPIGTALTFISMSSATVAIAITSDTLYLAKDGTTGSRTLAQYGVATAIKMTATTWIISGSGLT